MSILLEYVIYLGLVVVLLLTYKKAKNEGGELFNFWSAVLQAVLLRFGLRTLHYVLKFVDQYNFKHNISSYGNLPSELLFYAFLGFIYGLWLTMRSLYRFIGMVLLFSKGKTKLTLRYKALIVIYPWRSTFYDVKHVVPFRFLGAACIAICALGFSSSRVKEHMLLCYK